MMERAEILTAMGELKLHGMKDAYDEIIATAVKRQHEPQRVVGDLLTAEIAEKQARSIKYQITIAKLPLAKDIEDFVFDSTPINETLVRDLAGGDFLAHQRNLVLVGGTGTGKTHLAIGIARACIRKGARGHALRHACAMIILQATQDIRKVSLWLGHATLTTTEVYTRGDPTEKLDATEAIVPPHLRRGAFQPSRLYQRYAFCQRPSESW